MTVATAEERESGNGRRILVRRRFWKSSKSSRYPAGHKGHPRAPEDGTESQRSLPAPSDNVGQTGEPLGNHLQSTPSE